MHPNPNNGTFTVKGSLRTNIDEEVSLIITDMLGKVIYKKNTIAQSGNINEQVVFDGSFANGMYLLEVRSGIENKVFHFVIGR